MKGKLILGLLLIFIGGFKSYGQKTESIKDSDEEFNLYANRILDLTRDSIVPDSLPNKYQIIYVTACPFMTEDNLGPNCRCFTEERSLARNHFIAPGFFLCGESPTKINDKTSYHVYLDNSTNSYITYPEIIAMGSGNTTDIKIVSFETHTYLILEQSFIISLGSQTSRGFTRTIFLEKID